MERKILILWKQLYVYWIWQDACRNGLSKRIHTYRCVSIHWMLLRLWVGVTSIPLKAIILHLCFAGRLPLLYFALTRTSYHWFDLEYNIHSIQYWFWTSFSSLTRTRTIWIDPNAAVAVAATVAASSSSSSSCCCCCCCRSFWYHTV